MNRFEILSERIGAIGKNISEYETMYGIKKAIEQIDLGLKHPPSDNEEEAQFVKKQITNAFYGLITIAHKHNHCAACLCSDLEEMIRIQENIRSNSQKPSDQEGGDK